MALAAFKATVNQALPDGNYSVDSASAVVPNASSLATHSASLTTDAAAADTNTGTGLTDTNTAAAAIIAITGDTYNTTTHQFTFGGATGLTHAQWATVGALLNTALADFTTAKTKTALVVTDAANVAADSTNFTATVAGDVVVTVNRAVVTKMNQVKAGLRAILQQIAGSGIVTP